MTSSRMSLRILAALALAAVLAGCNERKDPGYQGWVEADMIFVSPDESGRVIKLNVREGDEIKQGAPLYSVDDDLQKADLNQNNATLANAQQTYDRAASLSKTGSGTQANLDSAVSALRVACNAPVRVMAVAKLTLRPQPRRVSGRCVAAAAAMAAVTPGTTSHATPACAKASSSSSSRPNTLGSPPFSRTTTEDSLECLTSSALIVS